MLELFRNSKILVVVAHPDDEVLGLGGTMNKLIEDYNCEVHALILGEGITSRSDKRVKSEWSDKLKKHRDNIDEAKEHIGYQKVYCHQFPDNRFDAVDLLDLIKVVEKVKNEFLPDHIFTHHGGDVNIDHQRVFEAVIVSTRPLKEENNIGIFTFETMSGTEWIASNNPFKFNPNLFVELEQKNIDSKILAMESYEFERRSFPHPRSPEALNTRARMWGVTNGMNFAEAFQIIRLRLKL